MSKNNLINKLNKILKFIIKKINLKLSKIKKFKYQINLMILFENLIWVYKSDNLKFILIKITSKKNI